MRPLRVCGIQRVGVGEAADFEKHADCASSPYSRSATVRARGSLKTAAASSNHVPCLCRLRGAISRQAGGATGKLSAKGQVVKRTKCQLLPQATAGLVREERPKPELPRKRRSGLRSDAAPSARRLLQFEFKTPQSGWRALCPALDTGHKIQVRVRL